MAQSHLELAARFRSSLRQWFQNRLEECVRCCECQRAVSPWDAHCPNCGQENPARISTSAAVYLVIGALCLAFVLILAL